MVHDTHPDIRELVWAGRYDGPAGAVAKAARLYDKEKCAEYLFLYASTLYSARKVRKEHYVPALLALRQELVSMSEQVHEREFTPNQLDVLSTILEWMSNRKELLEERYGLVAAALAAVSRGLELAGDEREGGHTKALLLLTGAQLRFAKGQNLFGYHCLGDAGRIAPLIRDPNQKARVYRKIGAIRLMRGQLVLGLQFLWKARSVEGTAPDVRAKNPL